ncbi:MAG: RNA polymerase sigma factor [Acidimicrobiales bacterium]
MDPSSLDAALEGARDGDEWGITALFRAFQPQLLGYLRHHAPDVAEDLASETWLAAAKGLHGFEGGIGDFRAWLFTIARRRVVDHYRSRARRPMQVRHEPGREPIAPDDTADLVVGEMSSREAITALTRELSADQAEVVLLRVVADLSVDDVAKIMKRSPGSVRVLQHRALRTLGKVWEQRSVTR